MLNALRVFAAGWVLLGSTLSLAADAPSTPATTDQNISNKQTEDEATTEEDATPTLNDIAANPKKLVEQKNLGSTLATALLIGMISLAPAAALMTTSYVRISVVLGILRHAIGLQNLPSTQTIAALALFLSALVMAPTWRSAYEEGVAPYQKGELQAEEAFNRGISPVRQFMSRQIDRCGNSEDVWLMVRFLPEERASVIQTYDDVPLRALLPAFLISELKTAFLIGFQLLLPFMIVDLVASATTVSMGMIMTPPQTLALPFKLLLFVLVDGWRLVVETLMLSFAPLV